MYRYSPPKSSVWGHGLRKMSPAREKQLSQQFLETAVAEYEFAIASLNVGAIAADRVEAARQVVRYFERLLGRDALNTSFPILTKAEFDRCLAALISTPDFLAPRRPHISLSVHYKISQWRIRGAAIPTQSTLAFYFGTSPRIITFLLFSTVSEFKFVQSVLAELGLCTLSDKHLKLDKRAARARKKA